MQVTNHVASAAEEEEKQQPTISMEMTTDPWMLFLYALKAPATKEKYIQRLIKFLDFLGYQGTKEEKACAFAAQSRTDPRMRLTLSEILPNQT